MAAIPVAGVRISYRRAVGVRRPDARFIFRRQVAVDARRNYGSERPLPSHRKLLELSAEESLENATCDPLVRLRRRLNCRSVRPLRVIFVLPRTTVAPRRSPNTNTQPSGCRQGRDRAPVR